MRKACRAFTILELLVAIVIAAVLVLICGVLMRMGAEDHRDLSTEMAWERSADLLIEQVTSDLNSAHSRLWYDGGDTRTRLVGWYVLRPKAVQEVQQAIGDLCAVGYALSDFHSRSPRSSTEQVMRCVVRIRRDSAEVYRAIEAEEEHELWQLDNREEVVAEGIVDVELWPLFLDEFGVWQTWDDGVSVMPEAVELRLVMTSPELQSRLKTAEDWDWARSNYHRFGPSEIREQRTLIHLGTDAR